MKGKIGAGIVSGGKETNQPVRHGAHDFQDIDAQGNGDEDE